MKSFLKEKGLGIVRNAVVMLANYCLIVMLVILCYSLIDMGEITSWRLVALAFLPIINFSLRKKMNQPWSFVLGHLVAAGAFGCIINIFSLNIIEIILYLIVLAILFGSSFYWRDKDESGEEQLMHPVFVSVVAFIFLFLNARMGKEESALKIIYAVVAFFGLYFTGYYIDNYRTFIKLNRIGQTKFQEKKLLSYGSIIAGSYTAFTVFVLMICTGTTFMNKLGLWIKEVLKDFLIWILSHIDTTAEKEPEVEQAAEALSRPMEIGEKVAATEFLETFWKILEYILIGAFLIGVIIGIFAAIRAIIQKIRGMLGKDISNEENVIEDLVRERSYNLKRTQNERKEKRRLFDFSNEKKIRKTYAKFIAKRKIIIENKSGKELSYLTATQSVNSLTEDKEFGLIASIYEKARYGNLQCTSEDVSKINNLVSKLR